MNIPQTLYFMVCTGLCGVHVWPGWFIRVIMVMEVKILYLFYF